MAIEDDSQVYGHPMATALFSNKKIESSDRDAIYLARFGKQQRNFGFFSMIGLTSTLMLIWEGVILVFSNGYENGGPASLIYGFLIIWIGNLSIATVMGELVSMIPSAGGQYHWVFLLAPKNCRKLLSYITGWLTCIGWIANVAGVGLACGSLVQALIILNNDTYTPERYQGTLITWAAILLTAFVNIILRGILPKLEGFIFMIHIVGFFALLIPLVFLGPKDNTKAVFTTLLNGGEWSTQELSFFISLAGNSITVIGVDGAVHMSEEIKNPRSNVPKAMLVSMMINCALGFGMLLALLICAGDLTAAFDSPTGYPFLEIFTQATQSARSATAMASIIVILTFGATIGLVAAASRQLWAFARDRGVPGWQIFGMIHTRTSVPMAAILVVTGVPCLLSLINIGSTTVFSDILSLIQISLFSSYEIAAILFLYRRYTGRIIVENENRSDNSNPPEQLTWGPWRLRGVLGIANNIFACIYLAIIIFFSFFPLTAKVLPSTMNYGVLVFGAAVLFSIIYYFLWANRFYTGPMVEVS